MTGTKVTMVKLLNTKNKYKKENNIERITTDFLKIAIIEKECIRRLKKFI